MVAKRVKLTWIEEEELYKGRKADIQDSHKYLGITQATGDHDKNAEVTPPNNSRKKSSLMVESFQYTHTTGQLIHNWNNKLTKGENGCHWCQDTKNSERGKEGGRQIVTTRATIHDQAWNICKHISEMTLWDELLQESLRQLKTDVDEEQEEDLSPTIKPLHGMYNQQTEGLADIK